MRIHDTPIADTTATRRARHLMVAVAALCGGVGSAACGDDSGSLTATEFLAQGNAICERGGAEIEVIFTSANLGADPTPEQLTAVLVDVMDNVDSQLDDIDALTPPDDLADEVDELLTAVRAVTAEARANPSDYLELEDSGNDPFVPSNELAADLGLTTCAEE